MLGVSGLGLISNAVVVSAYFCGQKAANDASSVASIFSIINMIVHLILWAVASGLFRQQNQNGVEKDLWSWSCSPTADARAEAFKEVVNYDFLCKSNVSLRSILAAQPPFLGGFSLITLTIIVSFLLGTYLLQISVSGHSRLSCISWL